MDGRRAVEAERGAAQKKARAWESLVSAPGEMYGGHGGKCTRGVEGERLMANCQDIFVRQRGTAKQPRYEAWCKLSSHIGGRHDHNHRGRYLFIHHSSIPSTP